MTSSMSSDVPNVTRMSLEQVVPDLAFVMKTIRENPVVIQSIMVLIVSCHPELAFDKVTLELAAFREFMQLKLNKDRADELAGEAISLHQQRQNQFLTQKETVSFHKNRDDRTSEAVQCHIRPVLSNTHFLSNEPSCLSSIIQELIDHKKALSQIQLSQGNGIQLSENCVQSVNLCQIPETSSMLNSVIPANVSTESHSSMVGNSIEIKEGQNKNCEFQSQHLMPRASLECGKKVQCSVHLDLCQKDCQASVKIPELDSGKIDYLGKRFQSVLNLQVECSNSAAVQTSTVSGISVVPTVYSQQNKSMATGCIRVMSESSVVTQFLPGIISQCMPNGFGERIGTAPRFQLLGDQRASATTDKPGLNLTIFDDTSYFDVNNVVTNAGQVKLLNESSKVHSSSFERKNCSQEFFYDQPFRNSGCVKPSAEYKEVGTGAEHSTKLTAKNGNWSVSGHPDSNGLSHLKKSDVCRTDFQGLVKHEIVPNSKGLCYQQSQNVGNASGRPYILHFSHAVSSEHSMCNCHKKQDLDVRDFDLRPELRKVISELDFGCLTKVQHCCLRPLLDGLDVICAERSGSGKTTLLALSTLQHLQSSSNQVAVLVMCHTYKAMVDVYDCFIKCSAYIDNVRVCILKDKYESGHNLQHNQSQILIGSVQSVLRLTYIHPDLFLQLKHFIIEDCDVLLRQTDICKSIEKIAKFMPQEKQVILMCRKMFPFIGNMFKKLAPYEVRMTTNSF